MNEPRIPARESGKLLLMQACKPAGRPVGEGQPHGKKRHRLKWDERTNRHVEASDVGVSYRTPEPARLRNVLRIWKENA